MAAPNDRLLSKRKVQEVVESIDPSVQLEPDVEDVLLDIADDFIDSVVSFACRLAEHRKSQVLEARDIQLHLERTWNIHIPGFSTLDETRTVRKPSVPEAHRQRSALVKRSAAALGAENDGPPSKRARN